MGDVADFGERLLRWAEAQRTTDGIGDPEEEEDEREEAGRVTLNGNAAWKTRLQRGEIVEFRGGGNSLMPKIRSGECCQYLPVTKHEDIKENDIVFCQIKGRYWGHRVKSITKVGGEDEKHYTISNMKGWENGT